jgi:very-short-patch-repair endonuclease
MDRLRQNARALRRNPTEAEKLLWLQLRYWQIDGAKFRRQQPSVDISSTLSALREK